MAPRAVDARQVQIALDYVRAWGVPVWVRPTTGTGSTRELGSNFSTGPSSCVGLVWDDRPERRRLIFDARGGRMYGPPDYGPQTACAVVHELSHILVGETPWDVEEEDSELLALDWYGQQYLKLRFTRPWWQGWFSNWKRGEARSPTRRWTELPPDERRARLGASFRKALARGLLAADGTPTFKQAPAGQPTVT